MEYEACESAGTEVPQRESCLAACDLLPYRSQNEGPLSRSPIEYGTFTERTRGEFLVVFWVVL